MIVNIQLSSELEETLQQSAAAAGQDVDSFVRDVVVEQLSNGSCMARPRLSPQEFRRRLDRIAKLHQGSPAEFDDRRESIYAGRGE